MGKELEGKPEPTLVYPSTIYAIARIRRYGINKYGDSENWRDVPDIDYLDATLRHILKDLSGEEFDSGKGGSNESHIAHALTNLSFIYERRYGKGSIPKRVKRK
jgi:hypothetical protein